MKLKSIITVTTLGILLTGCSVPNTQDSVYDMSNQSWRWVLDSEYNMLTSTDKTDNYGTVSNTTVITAKISFHKGSKAFFTIATSAYSFGFLCDDKELHDTALRLNGKWLKAAEKCHSNGNSIGKLKMLSLSADQVKAIIQAGYLKVDGNSFPTSGFHEAYHLSLDASLASGHVDQSSYTDLLNAWN
ncbi:hypothetical protein AL552_08850 (plasmid) [Vibrio diabolicus]|uniref:hypothetical protein n=1 Tax=Vibrio diabolicus TaxID=50719 RepID=UPI000CE93D89|nr:hypothetical protein [Vibrio diabolicus]AVF93901.1 hypothetical protein AL552_08850 [Vibrio diabolicus]